MNGDAFSMWAMLELMGHRRLFGFVSEQEVAGGKMLRIDIPDASPAKPHVLTQFYGIASVYAISPVSEDICRRMAARSVPAPVHAYELPALPEQGDDDVDG